MIACSLSDPRMVLFNANFSVIDLKIHKKDIYPFFIIKAFFFKTILISALMILVNLFSLVVSAIVLFTCFFNEPVYGVLAP